MKTYCSKCNTKKENSEFTKNATRPNGLGAYCKKCQAAMEKACGRSFKGVIRHIYASQKRSSEKREMELPLYTQDELYDFCSWNDKFIELYNKWEDNGYETMMKPSLDRIDYSLPYSLDNIRVMTWGDNFNRQNTDDRNKPKRELYKIRVSTIIDGEKVIFDSLNKARIYVGLSNSQDIKNSIIRNGTAGGFKWQYE